MARAPTTLDAFSAVAEPQRRQILDLLVGSERTVGDIARAARLEQPQVSKHLRVLREVGLVRVRASGKERYYALEEAGLKPIHDWVQGYARQWTERFDRLEDFLKQEQDKGDA